MLGIEKRVGEYNQAERLAKKMKAIQDQLGMKTVVVGRLDDAHAVD
jgi:hypothetical protein